MRLIGIAGRAGVGKDTAALHLSHGYDAVRCAFAEPLYTMLAGWMQMTENELEPLMTDRDWKEAPLYILGGLSPRQALQKLGDWVRSTFGEDVLVRHLETRLHALADISPGTDFVVITDVRKDIEADWVRQHGGHILHLTRDDAPTVADHHTEAGVCMYEQDLYAWNNGTIDQMHERLDLIMTRILAWSAA